MFGCAKVSSDEKGNDEALVRVQVLGKFHIFRKLLSSNFTIFIDERCKVFGFTCNRQKVCLTAWPPRYKALPVD